MFRTVGFVTDATRHGPPEDRLTVFRGAALDDKTGMSWTTRRAVADVFRERSANLFRRTSGVFVSTETERALRSGNVRRSFIAIAKPIRRARWLDRRTSGPKEALHI